MNNAGGKAASDEHRLYSMPHLRHIFSNSRLSRPSNSATMSSTRRPDVPEPVYKGEKWSAEPSAKKRKGNETWAKNIAKKQRDSGQECVSVTTKATKPAASVGAPCACPKKCFDVVGADKIQGIFREYWAMASHNAQSSYLATRVSRKEVARHRINSAVQCTCS